MTLTRTIARTIGLPAVGDTGMRRFWDDRAREDAYFFIDNRLELGNPDTEQFWSGGETDLDKLLGTLGARLEPTDAVVEIGCGIGRLTRVIAGRTAKVWALDVSERMLELAREHNPGLGNVRWLLGDGATLAGVDDRVADACVSHVVFQHIPDPGVTLGYVREIGRVLRPDGWAAFQISNDPAVHRPKPGGINEPEWLGSHVELSDLERAADDGGMEIERVVGEGTQFCVVLARRRAA